MNRFIRLDWMFHLLWSGEVFAINGEKGQETEIAIWRLPQAINDFPNVFEKLSVWCVAF